MFRLIEGQRLFSLFSAGRYLSSRSSTLLISETQHWEPDPAPFNYPVGLGNVLMNGCYETEYKEGDPCYVTKWTLDACLVWTKCNKI